MDIDYRHLGIAVLIGLILWIGIIWCAMDVWNWASVNFRTAPIRRR